MRSFVYCSVCGKQMEPNNGGYGHPSKCWHCAPVAVSQRKIRRAIRENRRCDTINNKKKNA